VPKPVPHRRKREFAAEKNKVPHSTILQTDASQIENNRNLVQNIPPTINDERPIKSTGAYTFADNETINDPPSKEAKQPARR
jgi:hypothetical protein